MIKENYVSFKTAKKLKEKGFPQNISFGNYYELIDKTCLGEVIIPYTQVHFDYPEDYLYYPTLSLVQKWLREEKGIHVDVISDTDYPEWTGEFYYSYDLFYCLDNKVQAYEHDGFKTYEEALEAGINKALELI